MPALLPTGFTGEVIWLGRVLDRADSLRATEQNSVFAGFSGVEGEHHAGLVRASCNRVVSQYPVGTEIRNTRQFTILSAEELDKIAANAGLSAIDPAWLGASMVIRGIPDFTHIPPSSRLQITGGATLTIDMHNRPCHLPAKVIDQDAPGFGRAFKAAADDLRGVTAWVEREGQISIGDKVTLHIPDQAPWKYIESAQKQP